jgi:hypothetical protein
MRVDFTGQAWWHIAIAVGVVAAAVTAVAFGGIVIGAAIMTGKVAASTLAWGMIAFGTGSSLLMQASVVGRAQYEHSRSEGDVGWDLVDDVSTAITKQTFRFVGGELLYQMSEKGIMVVFGLTDFANYMSNPKGYQGTVMNTFNKWANNVSFGLLGLQAGETFVAHTSSNDCYDYALELGWKPE